MALSGSGLDSVILCLSALKNDFGLELSASARRSFTDVAATLATLIHTPAVRQKTLELSEGPAPISDAVAAPDQ